MAGVAVLLAWLISPACSSSRALAEAEQAILGALELDALEEAGDSAGFDVSGTLSRLLAGDLDPPAALAEMAGGAVRAVAGDLGGLAASLAVPAAVSLPVFSCPSITGTFAASPAFWPFSAFAASMASATLLDASGFRFKMEWRTSYIRLSLYSWVFPSFQFWTGR